MSERLLSAAEAAERLGLAVTTLYGMLGDSDRGLLSIRGQRVTVRYYQSGPAGQGRILIEPSEIERHKQLMLVQPQHARERRLPMPRMSLPGITVPLGRPHGPV